MKNSPLSSRKTISSVFYTDELSEPHQDEPSLQSAHSLNETSKRRLIDTRNQWLSADSAIELPVKFEGFVRKRQDLLIGKKKSKDLGWHVQWVVVVGNMLRFYLVKYLNSAVSDEQPLPTKKPPPEALVPVGQVPLSSCHVGQTPTEIQEQKGAISTKIITLAFGDGSLFFLELVNATCVSNFLRSIGREGSGVEHKPSIDSIDIQSIPFDSETESLLERVYERRLLLQRLEEMEEMFVGAHRDPTLTHELRSRDLDIKRGAPLIVAQFTAKLTEDYFLIPGVESTRVTPRDEVKVYGIMEDGRWRCEVNKDALYEFSDNEQESGATNVSNGNLICEKVYFPLIGSLPMSVIANCQIITSLEEI
ncbi:hypothetical protein LOD99_1045 [Oopsacas minuta]|uniref:PH domain-containing protein n=1 Tax=Oopsacas minuta TaxID=111878 RepID=A0AAV7K0G1_9METZ|nr:hypothetical protein LOD99_1045 [Oopsacas minuta]